ncbi:hypothetical protein ACK2IE_22680 [Clostridioides difficile]
MLRVERHTETLKELQHNDILQTKRCYKEIKDVYNVKEVRCNIDKQYTNSYFVTMAIL